MASVWLQQKAAASAVRDDPALRTSFIGSLLSHREVHRMTRKQYKITLLLGISVYRSSQMSGVSEAHIRDLERGDRDTS